MNRDFILYLCCAIPSSISLLSTSIVFFLYFRYIQLHNKSFTTIIILCIFDAIGCISILIPYTESKNNRFVCQIQGFFVEFSTCSSILWIGKICMIIFKDTFEVNLNLYKNLFKSLIFVIIFAFVLASLPFTFSGYDYVYGHCWISGKTNEDRILRVFVSFLPLIIIILISGVALVVTACKVNNNSSKTMIYYALILILGYMPIFFTRLLEIFSIDIPFGYLCFSYFFYPLIGCANSVLLGFTSGIEKISRKSKVMTLFSEMGNF